MKARKTGSLPEAKERLADSRPDFFSARIARFDGYTPFVYQNARSVNRLYAHICDFMRHFFAIQGTMAHMSTSIRQNPDHLHSEIQVIYL